MPMPQTSIQKKHEALNDFEISIFNDITDVFVVHIENSGGKSTR